MKSKDEVLHLFKAYYNMIETKFDMKTKALQFDKGKEYYVKESQSYLSYGGIESRTLCAYTRAEWFVRSDESPSERNECFKIILVRYSDGILTAALISPMTSKVLRGKSSVEVLSSSALLFWFHLKWLGIHALYTSRSNNETNQTQSKQFIIVGYPSSQKGYKCNLSGKSGRVIVTMRVKFHEEYIP